MEALFGGVRPSNTAIGNGNERFQTQFRVEKGQNDASKAIYSQNEYLFNAYNTFCPIKMC